MKNSKMEIIIDDREQNNKIVEELKKLDIVCSPQRTKSGDYLYKDVVIEMKSVDDFSQSIMDGRLKKQVQMMNKDNSFLLVYGRISDRKTEIDENCILGMLVSLTLGYRTKIIWVDNEKQIAFVMKRIFERYDLEEMKGGEKC